MNENIPFGSIGHNKEGSSSPQETYIQDLKLGGVAGQLEEIFQSGQESEALKKFPDLAFDVDKLMEIIKNADGTPLLLSELIKALRIWAKEERLSGQADAERGGRQYEEEYRIHWDATIAAAKKDGYKVVAPAHTDSGLSFRLRD